MEELKKQAHKEFDEQFTHIDFTGQREMNLFCVSTKTKDDPIFEEESEMVKKHKSFIDSIIDKTVQMTEERIVNRIKNEFKCEIIDGVKTGTAYMGEEAIISLITNKSDINKDKE